MGKPEFNFAMVEIERIQTASGNMSIYQAHAESSELFDEAVEEFRENGEDFQNIGFTIFTMPFRHGLTLSREIAHLPYVTHMIGPSQPDELVELSSDRIPMNPRASIEGEVLYPVMGARN